MLDNQPTTPTTVNADLDAALRSFASYQPIQASASSLTPGVPQELTIDSGESPELEAEGETVVVESPEETTTEDKSEEQELPSGFAEDFKKVFGIEPTEAIETFNSLIAFRDEVRLMGEWNVTPSEYQSRMSQVRNFFKTLPEGGQAQFNSVEGAVAIWNHLQQTGAPQKKTSGVRPSSKTTKAAPKADVIRKSEVLRMDDRTLRANAARINQAVIEGRFIEDV